MDVLPSCRAEQSPSAHLAWRGRGQYIANRRGRRTGDELRVTSAALHTPPSS